MIEKILLDYLKNNMSVSIGLEVPKDKGQKYVVFEKIGETEENYIKTATIAIQCISSKSLYEAASLKEDLIKVMREFITLDGISACKKQNDYNFTDTTTKEYRYQAVYEITYK